MITKNNRKEPSEIRQTLFLTEIDTPNNQKPFLLYAVDSFENVTNEP